MSWHTVDLSVCIELFCVCQCIFSAIIPDSLCSSCPGAVYRSSDRQLNQSHSDEQFSHALGEPHVRIHLLTYLLIYLLTSFISFVPCLSGRATFSCGEL